MTGDDIVDRVESAVQTELSRLGSSKALYAATEGDLDGEQVLAALAVGLEHAADRLRKWAEADPMEPDDVTADRIEDAFGMVRAEFDGPVPDTVPAGIAVLPIADDPDERAGALLGWALVTERTVTQVTGYFTGQADPGTASAVREIGDEILAVRDVAATAPDDADRAVEAAVAVVEDAYQRYFETLEALGVNPKPICG